MLSVGEDFSSPTGGCCLGLELHFQGELMLPWNVVRVGLRNLSEARVTKRISRLAILQIEVGRVGDVECLHTELHVHPFRDRKVLEE